MVAITTIDGHVARAKEFQARNDIYVAVGRQTPWDTAKLTGTVSGTTFNTDPGSGGDNTLGLEVYTAPIVPVEFSVTFTVGTETPIATIINEINDAWQAASGETTLLAANVGGRIVLTCPGTGDGTYVGITKGNLILGFAFGASAAGSSADPPPPNPMTHRIEEVVGYKKADVKSLVVPDADTAATLVGSLEEPFIIEIGSDSITVQVDSLAFPIDVVLSGTHLTADEVANQINARYQVLTSTPDTIASRDGRKIRLTSPTSGGGSFLQILNPTTAPLGFTVGQTDAGHAGGTIHYRDTQWRVVDPANAFEEGSYWVYLEANLNYDEFPLADFRQIGWYSYLVPASLPAPDPLLPDQVSDPGVLEIVDNREVINRALDEKEKLTVIIEF